ncbi:MAG: GntR family transcriptional regulator [Pirellulales bacterium]|nr:GntR family transcriptional regulator [Pirellulales bacterium]
MKKSETATADKLGIRAYQEIRAQILSGKLKPGQRLSLRSVAGSLGVSIAPVGEAFRELARDGLLESEPGWGTRVRQLTVESLRSQHILRMAVECEAARRCCEHATDAQLAALGALAAELDERIDRDSAPEDVHGLDSQFHLRVAELSGAPSLVETLQANQLVRMLARGSVLAYHREKPTQQHVLLANAIKGRDPDDAERAMREHCERSMRLQLSAMVPGSGAS